MSIASSASSAQPFDYRSFFARSRDLETLTVSVDDVTWLERHKNNTRESADVVLYLGCNLLMTPHIAQESIKIFEHLGLDFVAVGAQDYCCGAPYRTHGPEKTAIAVESATMQKLSSFNPSVVVMECPSCNKAFDKNIMPRHGAVFPMPNLAPYLLSKVHEFNFFHTLSRRIAVHTHNGSDHADEDSEATIALLKAIPGVTIVGTISMPELSYQCGSNVIRRIGGIERFREMQSHLMAQANRLGADTIATVYHSCHREWSGIATKDLAVRNYVSILAEALGVNCPDYFQIFRRAGSCEQIVNLSEGAWSSRGLSRSEATDLVNKYFGEGKPYAPAGQR